MSDKKTKNFHQKFFYDLYGRTERLKVKNSHVTITGSCSSFMDLGDMPSFWDEYLNMIEEGIPMSIGECRREFTPITIDVDLSYSDIGSTHSFKKDVKPIIKDTFELLTNFHSNEFIDHYRREIKPITEKELFMSYLTKDSYINPKGMIKHGFHLQCPLIYVSVDVLENLLTLLQKKYPGIDKGIRSPWLLLGSTKNSNPNPYKITRSFIYKNGKITEIDTDNFIRDNITCEIPFINENLSCGCKGYHQSTCITRRSKVEYTKPIRFYHPLIYSICNFISSKKFYPNDNSNLKIEEIKVEKKTKVINKYKSDFIADNLIRDFSVEIISEWLNKNNETLQVDDRGADIRLVRMDSGRCPVSNAYHDRENGYAIIKSDGIYIGCYRKCKHRNSQLRKIHSFSKTKVGLKK